MYYSASERLARLDGEREGEYKYKYFYVQNSQLFEKVESSSDFEEMEC